MSSDSITARYLAAFGRPIFPLPESYSARIRYAGRYLSRPMFLDTQELGDLERDLAQLRSALSTLPARLFDGRMMAFARAVGMTERQAECVLRGSGLPGRAMTHMARADLYKDTTGFRLLEWNLGSTTGGVECVDMCRALLAVPELAAFVAEEGLAYADTYAAMVTTLRSETGCPVGTSPVVALVDTPGIFSDVETWLRDKAARWLDFGLSTMVGHLGELTRSNGRLCMRGEPIDVVFRNFTFEDMLSHIDDGLLEPLLSTVERGEVRMFTPLDTDVYASKGALALLSDPDGQLGLTPGEREACARLVPWTRRLRAGQAFLEDGADVDLVAYTLEHQRELVLKPSLSYGGNGVVVGADPDVTPAAWRDLLAHALNGAYVVQRLVRPTPELFPTRTPGRLDAWTVTWGVFTMREGYAGILSRALPADGRGSVVNFGKDEALIGCGFHALS